jgi:hypothetical protein
MFLIMIRVSGPSPSMPRKLYNLILVKSGSPGRTSKNKISLKSFKLLQYLTYSLILVLISGGVYQMMISVLKMVVLSVCGTVYLIVVHLVSAFLFDQQDHVLQEYG